MIDNLCVKQIVGNDERQILDLIYSDPVLVKTFLGDKNTISRILTSIYTALIILDDEVIGFVLFVDNERTGKVEIDMGILSDYRNKGYGTMVLKKLKSIIIQEKLDVEIEIKEFNVGAINSVVKNGFVLNRKIEDRNYYVLGKRKKLV